jgi:hypothetical protein
MTSSQSLETLRFFYLNFLILLVFISNFTNNSIFKIKKMEDRYEDGFGEDFEKGWNYEPTKEEDDLWNAGNGVSNGVSNDDSNDDE